MKKIFLKIILINLLFLVSCTEDYIEYNAPDEVSDFTWVVGLDQNKTREDGLKINIDTHLSFIDLSVGYVAHKWTIEDHNRFLKPGFKKGDSLALFIKNEASVTTDAKAHVLFTKSGINTVQLYNTYDAPVTKKTSLGTLKSVETNGLHVIDTTFQIDVYGYIKPVFKIQRNITNGGDKEELIDFTIDEVVTANSDVSSDVFTVPTGSISLTDKSTWPTVEVKVAGSLTYEDLSHTFADGSTGRPNNRKWETSDGSPATGNGVNQIMKFFRLGTFEAGTITANRLNLGAIFPQAATTKPIPLMVKVVASNDNPLVINGKANETQDEKLRIQVTGEIEDLDNKQGFFTVNVTNVGYSGVIPVKNVTMDQDNLTFMELELTQPIFSSDVITVDYAGGDIKSKDGRTLADFNTEVNSFLGASILTANSWSGYEEGNTSHANGYLGVVAGSRSSHFYVGGPQNGDPSDPYWSQSKVIKFRGNGSLKFSSAGSFPRGNMQFHQYGLGLVDQIPAGTYSVSFMVYKETDGLDQFQTWGDDLKPQGAWDISGLETGVWHKVEKTVVLAAPIESRSKLTIVFPKGANPNAQSDRQTMYFDEFSMIPLEVR